MTDVRDQIDAAYAEGLRRLTCVVCEGGTSGGRDLNTMSLFQRDDGVVAGKCWRAQCGAYICGRVTSEYVPRAFEPKPLLSAYRTLQDGDRWADKWLATGATHVGVKYDTATWNGLRVLSRAPDISVWRLTALDGTRLGHATRNIYKDIITYKEADRPLYYSNRNRGVAKHRLWIFEDPMSAAVCGDAAIALLGTSLSHDLAEEIAGIAPKRVYVALDPGAEAAALAVYQRLVAAGMQAVYVPMDKDFKDMTPDERYTLMETYT